MVLQVSKIFSNGMKVVLKEQNGRTPGLLRVFDKNGCLIANREILKSKTFDRTDALEKMTLQEGQDHEKTIHLFAWVQKGMRFCAAF